MALALGALLLFLLAFAVILAAAELFTQAVEWLGHRLGIAETAVGSVLAAVGTAMPETLIPLIAILFVGQACTDPMRCAGHDVGIGAILGAPFLLSTAAMLVMGCAVLAFRKRRHGRVEVRIERQHARRDLGFFLPAYALALGAAFLPEPLAPLKKLLALLLVFYYGWYLHKVLHDERKDHGTEELPKLALGFLGKVRGEPATWAIGVQLVLGLGGIVGGAYLFVEQLQVLAQELGAVSPLVLSLILSPLATELPEKFNSVIWLRDRKDTLAFGNISGAMVFQSCFPVAVGLAFTAWDFRDVHAFRLEILSAVLALASATVLFLAARGDRLRLPVLAATGALYVVFLGAVAFWP